MCHSSSYELATRQEGLLILAASIYFSRLHVGRHERDSKVFTYLAPESRYCRESIEEEEPREEAHLVRALQITKPDPLHVYCYSRKIHAKNVD